jgi:hypothetical protein
MFHVKQHPVARRATPTAAYLHRLEIESREIKKPDARTWIASGWR